MQGSLQQLLVLPAVVVVVQAVPAAAVAQLVRPVLSNGFWRTRQDQEGVVVMTLGPWMLGPWIRTPA
jgi:hypothetical protein